MKVVVTDKTSFNQFQFNVTNIAYNDEQYVLTTDDGIKSFSSTNYLITII